MSANTTLISGPAPSWAWLRFLRSVLSIPCALDLLFRGVWAQLPFPEKQSDVPETALDVESRDWFYSKSPESVLSQPVNQDLLCLFVHWVAVGTL